MNKEKLRLIEESMELNHDNSTKVMEALESLVSRRDKSGDTLIGVISTLLRRNYYTGFSILSLSANFHNGPATLDLSRQMIEDMINLEWMLVNDGRKQARKFEAFTAIDGINLLDQDNLLADEELEEIDEELINNLKSREVEARKILRLKPGEVQWTYNKKNFEDLIDDIKKKSDKTPLTEKNLNRILWLYYRGNNLNHTNSGELLWFDQEEDQLIPYLKWCLRSALYVCQAVLFTIALRYTDLLLEHNPEDELAKQTQQKLIEQHKSSK